MPGAPTGVRLQIESVPLEKAFEAYREMKSRM